MSGASASETSDLPILHIWAAPNEWNVPAREPASLAALLILQLTAPGRFALAPSHNPDTSPFGTLPYLSHGLHYTSGVGAIMAYANNARLSPDAKGLDVHLTAKERAQLTAWAAHIENELGVLVAHAFYVLRENYRLLTHPSFARAFPVPQRYYVPERIREAYKPKLSAVGLWNPPEDDVPEVENVPKSFAERLKPRKEEMPQGEFKVKFGREKVVEKARATLEVYARLLRSNSFLFGDRPTTLDALLAAHILLLTEPPFPDSLLKDLVESTYPSLLQHARRVRSHAFSPGSEPIMAPTPTVSLASALIPKFWATKAEEKKGKEAEEREKLFRSYAWQRWAWIGTAVAATAVYVAMFVRIQLVSGDKEEEEEDSKDDDDVDDNGDDDDTAAAEAAAAAAAEAAAEAMSPDVGSEVTESSP